MSRTYARGFTLLEVLLVVAIIGALATIALSLMGDTRAKGRDAKRRADLTQIGRFLSVGCFMPDAGAGTYDLAPIIGEIRSSDGPYARYITASPLDPAHGTSDASGYAYIVDADGANCAMVANLEYRNAEVTLGTMSEPTPGGGTGVFTGTSVGPNGTNRYFQITN